MENGITLKERTGEQGVYRVVVYNTEAQHLDDTLKAPKAWAGIEYA